MMRCAEIVTPNSPLQIRDCEIPTPPEKGLVVKIVFTAVCRGDLYQKSNYLNNGHLGKASFSYNLPIIPGHEISGIVYSLGESVTQTDNIEQIQIGDEVLVYPFFRCDLCAPCKLGKYALCENDSDNAINMVGFGTPGGYANFISLPDIRNVLRVKPNLPMPVAATLPCCALTAYNAVKYVQVTTAIHEIGNPSVLIIGLGGIGLWAVTLARTLLSPDTRIICATRSKSKLEVARSLGALDTIIWNGDDIPITEYSKFDAIIDVVGSDKSIALAWHLISKGGIIASLGGFGGSFTVSLLEIAWKAVTLAGICTGSISQLQELMNLISEKQLITPPIVYYDGLSKVNDALDDLEQNRIIGRAVLKVA